MVEGGGLENRKARKSLGGSNPSSSANQLLQVLPVHAPDATRAHCQVQATP